MIYRVGCPHPRVTGNNKGSLKLTWVDPYTGWWFGTFFPPIVGMMIQSSNLTFIFFRGIKTTKQDSIWSNISLQFPTVCWIWWITNYLVFCFLSRTSNISLKIPIFFGCVLIHLILLVFATKLGCCITTNNMGVDQTKKWYHKVQFFKPRFPMNIAIWGTVLNPNHNKSWDHEVKRFTAKSGPLMWILHQLE